MIRSLLILFISIFLNAIEHKSELSLKQINYEKSANETIFVGNTKVELQNDFFFFFLKLE